MKIIGRRLSIFLGLFLLPMAGYTQNIITTVAGGGMGGDGGLAVNAWLDDVYDVYADDTGNFYIVELSSIRRVDHATGIIQTIAGTGVPGYSGDGGPAYQAKLYGADAIAFDKNGDYYIADNGAHCIRKVDAATNIISTVAGNGTYGNSGDGGPATSAQIGSPNDIALDAAGNLYIADEWYVIRKVDKQTGIISTVAGNGVQGTWSNGETAVGAQIGRIRGVCVDKNGNVYFADLDNHKIGKIDQAGILTTFCGTGVPGSSGDGALATDAEISCPWKLKVYKGEVYFSEYCWTTIRKIDLQTEIINTVAGNGNSGFSGDAGPAIQAQLNGPIGISFDSSNNMFISDRLNFRIRKVSQVTSVSQQPKLVYNIFPVPSAGKILVSADDEIKEIEVFNSIGSKVFGSVVQGKQSEFDISDKPDGVYIVNLITDGGMASRKIVITH